MAYPHLKEMLARFQSPPLSLPAQEGPGHPETPRTDTHLFDFSTFDIVGYIPVSQIDPSSTSCACFSRHPRSLPQSVKSLKRMTMTERLSVE